MQRKYQEVAFMSGGHTKGITAVKFNQEGTLLATAGLDAKVCLWEVPLGKLLHEADGNSPVTSLQWFKRDVESVLFGTRDGNLLTLSLTVDFAIVGFWAHKYPVEHIAIYGDLVASGALSELKVWRWDRDGAQYVCEAQLQGPPVSSYNHGKEVLVTSLHWLTSEQHGPLLMVTYMHHSVHLIETKRWTRVRTIPLPGKIASASVSSNGTFIAVSNLTKGFDVFRMETEEPVASFEHDIGEPMPTPVLFTHEGRAIIGGTTVGKVNVWDIHLMKKINSLPVPRGSKVLAITAHCKPGPVASQDQLLIATGVFNVNSPSICILWKAQEEETATSNKEVTVAGSVAVDSDKSKPGFILFTRRFLWAAGWIIIAIYIVLLAVDDAEL